MDMANWQNYRSQVNGMPAVFTANIEDLDVYHSKHLSKSCAIYRALSGR